MGMALLFLFIGLEIGLCIWTLAKQREKGVWTRNRLIVSGLQWGMIILLLLLPVGNKGLRFAGCFLILSIRFLIDVIRFLLMRHKGEKKLRGKVKSILAAVMGCILIAFSLIPAYIFTGYDGLETTGEYEVGMVSAILTDETRLESFETDGSHREVPIYVYYPEKRKSASEKATDSNETKGMSEGLPEGEFPLILFSHGAFGYYQSNSSTYLELASHGYVVISMDHPYHSFFTKDTTGKTILVDPNFIQSAMYLGNAKDGEVPEEEIFETTRAWMELRIADASFVLDELERQIQLSKGMAEEDAEREGRSLENASDSENGLGGAWYVKKKEDARLLLQLLARIDEDKIGMMGHSLGGATSVTMGRLRSDVKAVIDLDGTMLGEELAYENGRYQYYEEAYPIPLLAINKQSHQESIEEYGTLYVNGMVLANAKEASYTYFQGSEHMDFTDLPLFSPFLASLLGKGSIDSKECIETTNGIVLQFFNHYLKGQGDFQIKECY